MARSLIRLPQLEGSSLPAGEFKFAKEAAGGDVLTFDTSRDEVTFASSQKVKILGDLVVEGSQTIVNSQLLTVEDSTIVAAIPNMRIADGNSPVASTGDFGFVVNTNVLTVNYDSGADHGLSVGDKFYAMSASLPEDIYTVATIADIGGVGHNNQFTAATSGVGNFTQEDGSFSAEILDSNSDLGGYLIPTEGGLIGLRFRNASNDLSIQGQDFHVELNSSLDGNVTLGSQASGADDITLTGTIQGATAMKFDGATKHATNRISLNITDPTAARTITLPDASGLVPVAVADIGGGGQGAEDLGLQLSPSGLLSIDINAVGEALVAGSGVAANDLDAADLMMLSDTADGANGAHSIKKTTLGQIQSFLAAGGTQKDSMVVSAPIALSSGNAAFDYSGTAPASQQMNGGVVTAFEAATESSREIYLNGVLMREGAANDCEVVGGSDIINFKFRLEADDVITVVARA